MNEQTRSELEELKRRHSRLEEELALLARQLGRLESELKEPERAPLIPPTPEPPRIVPQQPHVRALELAAILAPPEPPIAMPPQIPPIASAPPVAPAGPSPERRSFEMRLGTYWLVRIGMVMLLTGLVFFGNYAYQNFIGKIGPAGRVGLLYAASALLLGAGAWWQRNAARASLRNYAQVLFAGGMAAVYFTTYAAYHVETLRVIRSATMDGGILLAWAGYMVWVADRKKSEVLAWFAVGLAYYASIITRIGSFTLYSNLLLTVVAVVFLVRNRWAALSFASVASTYGAYVFWRFFDGETWHWATPGEGLWFGTYFLISYWVVFTAAVFLSKHERLAGPNRSAFLTLNNGAFFTLFVLTMLQVRQGGFWKFALVYGAGLVVLSELARRVFPGEPAAKNSYLTQGLLLLTIGFITRFAGLKLALILGVESVVLLNLCYVRKSLVLEMGAYVSGALSVAWGIDSLERHDVRGVWLGAALGALMALNAFQAHRKAAPQQALIRPVPAFFTLLALLGWAATTWYETEAARFPLALAIEAGALTFSVYVLGVPELAIFGQGYLLLAQGAWLYHFRYAQPIVVPPWWNPALLIGITLGLSHWWQRQGRLTAGTEQRWFWQGLYAMAIVGVTVAWLEPLLDAPSWLAWTSVLAVGATVYGAITRAWFLSAAAQIFLSISVAQFALQLLVRKPGWFVPLAPVVALGLLSFGTVRWFQGKHAGGETIRAPLLQLARIYRWMALLMLFWWVNEYIPAREQVWVLALLGLIFFLAAGWRRNSEATLFAGACTALAFAFFWLPFHRASTVYWPNLVVILVLLAEQRLAKRFADRYGLDARVQGGMIVLGGVSLWLLLYRWFCENASGFYLTAAWSVLALALFGCGLVLRERVYRWVGLGVLATALGRVFIFDVWRLETVYRILSFMALGIVLLVLGFIYNRYQEKIKEWL